MTATSSYNLLRTTATLGAGILKAKLGRDVAAKRYIIDTLSTMGPGLSAKAAQLLSLHDTSEGQDFTSFALSHDATSEAINRQAPALALQLAELSHQFYQGSLGQVHRGVLRDGREVAIKIQYPGIHDAIETQFSTLVRLAEFSKKIKLGNGLSKPFSDFLRTKLNQELDYTNELANQTRFRRYFSETSEVSVPDVIAELSTSTVLVQQWSKQLPLIGAATLSVEERIALGSALVRAFFETLFLHHEIHADLHQGNIGVSEFPQKCLILYDFGATLEIASHHVQDFAYTVSAIYNKKIFDPEAAFIGLGFDATALSGMSEKLLQLWHLFLEPISKDLPFSPQSWQFTETSAAILGQSRMRFRLAGPPWFLLFMRAYSSLIGSLKTMDCPAFRWWPILEPILKRHFEKSRETEHVKTQISPPNSKAKHLYIKVLEDNEEKVFLELPIRSVEWLEDLLPDSAREQVAAQGIDLKQIQSTALGSGCLPQTLFDAVLHRKHIRAWLE